MMSLDDLILRVAVKTPCLVGLAGRKQSGKDSLADVLVSEYGFVKVAFADALKEVALASNPWVAFGNLGQPLRLQDIVDSVGWDLAKEQHPEVRRFIRVLATEGIRSKDSAFWVRSAFAKIFQHERVVIPDVRFENEALAIQRADGYIAKVIRPSQGENTDEHASEVGIPDELVDVELVNDSSLEDWQKKAQIFALTYALNGLT